MADYSHLCGHVQPSERETEAKLAQLPIPEFRTIHAALKGSGAGKTMLLYKYYKQVTGHEPGGKQTGPDCVSWATKNAIDHTYCCEIAIKGEMEEWTTETCSEYLYGDSRVRIGNSSLGNGGGSCNVWCGTAAVDGVLARGKYGKYDLTAYDYSYAQRWGSPNVGVPQELFNIAKETRVKTVSLVTTYEELRDSLMNGYSVAIASNQAFSTHRGKYGICEPDYSTQWPHSLMACGFTEEYGEPLVCILNSWGLYLSGDTFLECPGGAFWTYASVIEKNMLSCRDSFSFSDKEGFPIKNLNLRLV